MELNKTKTAMQELKNIVEIMIKHGGDDDLFAVITHIDNHLEIEKQQIKNAFESGLWYTQGIKKDDEVSEMYYNRCFNK